MSKNEGFGLLAMETIWHKVKLNQQGLNCSSMLVTVIDVKNTKREKTGDNSECKWHLKFDQYQ